MSYNCGGSIVNRSHLPKKPATPESVLKQCMGLEQAFRDVIELGLQGTLLKGQQFSLTAWSEYPIEMLVEPAGTSVDSLGAHQAVRVKGAYKTPTEIGHNTFIPIGIDFVRVLPAGTSANSPWTHPVLECYWQVVRIRFYRSHTAKIHTIDF